MEIDMGFLQNITGFVTQGRNDADEWVTSYIAKGIRWFLGIEGICFQCWSPSYCLKTSHEFSVLIQVRLDDANRFNRLLASDTWRRYGLFVKKNRLRLFPEDLDIACSAHLFKNQMYQLAITRGKGGEVKLYVDGYHCASGSVEQAP